MNHRVKARMRRPVSALFLLLFTLTSSLFEVRLLGAGLLCRPVCLLVLGELLEEAVLLAHLLQQGAVLLLQQPQLLLQRCQPLVQLGLLRLKLPAPGTQRDRRCVREDTDISCGFKPG